MKRHLAWLAALAAVACAGCSEGLMQKHEAAVVRFDKDGKGLSVLLVYQGLHVGGGTSPADQAKNLEQAKQELSEFVASGRKFSIFLFGKIGLLEFEKADAVEVGPGHTVKFGALGGANLATAEERAKFAGMGQIEAHPFFLDPKEGLCLSQTITLNDPEGFFRTSNALISLALERDMTRQLDAPESSDGNFKLSKPAIRAILAAARARHDWFRITPGGISLNLPVSPGDAATILKQIETSPNPSDRAVIPMLKAFIENFDAKAGPDGLTLTMGDGQKRTIAIRPPADPPDQPRPDAELIEFARTLKLPFDKTPDVDSLIRDFSAK